ncbi:MAG: hypothetical protein Terrestrivirus1_248 [Terrestrivirus sp.]|uniref:Uncharacterized protein n=1 Tax=Terrestrivirus sp. TaxID=2487775 RepID=A0A3G4ZLT4_9VIRU|nr:MAG: hypothetical protein Terrestrivirus1_248 [Terrestrivirus sp.]
MFRFVNSESKPKNIISKEINNCHNPDETPIIEFKFKQILNANKYTYGFLKDDGYLFSLGCTNGWNYTFVFNSKQHSSPFVCIMSKGIPRSCNTQSSTSGEYTRSLELNRVTVQYKDNKVVFNTHEINGAVSWYKLDVSDFEYIIPFD